MENVFYPSEIIQLRRRINNHTSLSPFSYNVGERNILQIFFFSLLYFVNALQTDYNSSNTVYFLRAHINLCPTTQAKMNPRMAQNTYMPVNINSIVLALNEHFSILERFMKGQKHRTYCALKLKKKMLLLLFFFWLFVCFVLFFFCLAWGAKLQTSST